ncbi:MAG: hypothetical protein KatS3mg124_2461 [Porticoccaceae bacterium]|nr:MAG: hypothetical protein KatS3mg124_2461 [Porticoccaceae bacterium]
MIRRPPLLSALGGVLAALPLAALSSGIYKCTAPDGTVTYSANPYCESALEPGRRAERAREVDLLARTVVPPHRLLEWPGGRADLAELVAAIGRLADLPLEPVGLEGREVALAPSEPWWPLLERLAAREQLAWREAYGRIWVYRRGEAGETIVETSELLRWYQSEDSWRVVMRVDDELLESAAYRHTRLAERLNRLLPAVREALGEAGPVNAAEPLAERAPATRGIGSEILRRSGDGLDRLPARRAGR